jgi:hypothetical protein
LYLPIGGRLAEFDGVVDDVVLVVNWIEVEVEDREEDWEEVVEEDEEAVEEDEEVVEEDREVVEDLVEVVVIIDEPDDVDLSW